MTGRVCPVHGEYSATGVCRWCEPAPAPRCRCGEYAWEPPCPPDMREGVIGGVFHSEAQCFKLDATPPAEPVTFLDVALSGPKVLRIPVIEPTPWIRSLGPALHVERTESYIDAETHAVEESRLLVQHAALRWERVARRWAAKRRPLTWGDILERLTLSNPLLQDAPWKEPAP